MKRPIPADQRAAEQWANQPSGMPRRRQRSALMLGSLGNSISAISCSVLATIAIASLAPIASGQELERLRPTRLPPVSTSIESPTAIKPMRMPTTDSSARIRKLRASPEGLTLAIEPPLPRLLAPLVDEESEVAQTDFDPLGFRDAIEASLSSSILANDETPVQTDVVLSLPIGAQLESHFSDDFSPTPIPQSAMQHDGSREQWVYDAKKDVSTQHPWIEWGRVFYGDGITPRGRNWFGATNMVRPQFYMYGDFRSGIASGRNAVGRTDNWANRLNLDLDLKVTDTERFHGFVAPLSNGVDFTGVELVNDDLRFRDNFNLTPVTGFFEGDLGSMLGGALGGSSPFELPFTVGLVPLLFQNGIWMEDAVTGAAFSLPARHSRLLNWSNYDATFFAVFDQLNSPAFGKDEHAAQAFGTAWFIEAYGGYIETGYAYVHDRNNDALSYHNMTASFTRRYFDRISNSVRVIVNAGQDLPEQDRTADGALLLVENSWITAAPLTVVPYANLFVGWDRPQSVARAGVSGGILRNTGINFDTDALNGFATLDPTASDTAGGSLGIDLIGDDLDRQLLLEVSYLTPHGDKNASVPDDQFATGTRYQIPISNRTLLRFDAMYGWRRGLDDVYGTRMEYRWKF